MSDQIQESQSEIQSPEHVSLEKRFGVEDDKNNLKFDSKEQGGSLIEKDNAEKGGSYQDILSKVKTQENNDNDDVMQDASKLHQQMDRESQITHLIDLATTKGVGHAVTVARKAEDYYVLDQLHDKLLSEDLHDNLKAKGLIENK